MSTTSPPDLAEVRTKLAQLRDAPEGTTGASEGVLGRIYQFLIPNERTKPSNIHWFCSQAEQTTMDAATFLIRLHAYNSPRVDAWRVNLRYCLSTCVECVRGLQEVKVSSRHTFFGAFTDDVLENFYKSFSDWELKIVLEVLAEARIVSGASQGSQRTLSEAPPAVFYHLLSSLRILQDNKILEVLLQSTPRDIIPVWPTDAPPVGLLLLSMAQDPNTRQWAQSQLATIKTTPMPSDRFLPMYMDALEAATSAVNASQKVKGGKGACSSFAFAQESQLAWKGYCMVLRHVPKAWLTRSALFAVDVRQAVIGHLSDTGAHFVEVLKSFVLLLSRVGPDVWKGEGEEFPLVVLNTIKDNVRYSEILTIGKESWALSWLPTYLKSIGELPSFKEVLPAVVQFLCEELQRDRFKEVRPGAMQVASEIFLAVLPGLQDTPDSGEGHGVSWESLDIHTWIFVAVAFSKSFVGDQWNGAREGARRLVKGALIRDTKSISSAVSRLSKKSTPLIVPSVRKQMWKDVYDTIHPSDADSIGIVFAVLAQISHIDLLSDSAFGDVIKESNDPGTARKAFSGINEALTICQTGFSEAVSRLLDFSSSTTILRLLQNPEFAKHAMMLMFSPVEGIRQPAQELVGSALDVDSRLDCFRAFLVTCPGPSFHGMFEFLEIFTKYTMVVPEACNLSKSLALCLTDIIDAMCSRPEGLLLNSNFLKSVGGGGPAVELPRWWTLMTRAISNIFARTPRWAAHFESNVMILWMRDALIFGRDLLAQWKVIEAAALADSTGSTSGRRNEPLSHIGKKMMDDLQAVLYELSRWLRLTDEELLHQSFALLQTLLACFQETQVVPSDLAMVKLQKHIENAKKNDPSRPQTRLDSTRLERLRDTLSAFVEDDDEIQIIEPIPEPKHTRQSKLDSFIKKAPPQKKLTPIQAIQAQRPKYLPQRIHPTRPPAKTSVSSYFTPEDQKKLDSSVPLPKFTRQPIASSSKQVLPVATSVATAKSKAPPPPPSESSSSSSEESEGDDEGTLASLAKLQQRTPTIKKPAERRQVKLLDLPAHRKNPNLGRSPRAEDARRKAHRLKPDISSLHRSLLSWDYNHDGPEPPGLKLPLCRVPDRFTDPQHYHRVFQPLLLMECWAQIQQSKDETQDTFQCRINGKQYTSDWIDLDITITEGVRKDWMLMDSDIVLLQTPDGGRKFLGKAQTFKANHFAASIQATIRLVVSNSDSGPQIGTTWKVGKVFSLTTLHREYSALMALPYYDFCDMILQPVIPHRQMVDPGEVQRTMANYSLNDPQAKAVLSALQTDGFSLIQGPPGTGKTSTICALVHMFLARRQKPATMIHAGRNAGPPDKEPTRKVLLCAPSNAAIDEITFRLKDGVSGAGHKASSPKIVRVGAPKSINVSVKDVSLDALVEQKVNADPEAKNSGKDQNSELGVLRSELESVKKNRQSKFDELTNLHDNTARKTILEDEIKRLNKQKITLTHQLDKLKDKQKSDSRTLDAISRRCRMEVLQDADVICTTLAGAGHELLEMFDFEMVIIDEAAQAIELSSLIPLKYRSTRVIMVGDPQQLPPTVISQEASKFSYNQSLFVRLQKQRPEAVHLLSIQYRMHPDISQLPSKLFYNGRLMDGPDMASKTLKPWHTNPKFGTYRFYNVHRGQEEQGSFKSLVNRAECQVAVALYSRLVREFSAFDFDFKVGVVTMYRAQMGELRRAFEKKFGAQILATVDFNTVDGFQGQEKDIIILSCVRAGPGLQRVGFLADIRRMNVALTRAKSSVFVLGHAATLERSDDTWRTIVQDARTRARLVDTDVAFFTSAAVVPKPASQGQKVEKALPKAPQPSLPQGLSTPQALVASTRKVSQPSKLPSPPKGNGTPANVQAPIPTLKRPAPDDEPELPTPRPPNGENLPQKPKGKPPMKRPKQGPNLFIPQKRKPPPTNPGGSSSKRRA